MVQLEQMRVFEAVVAAGSFSRAALQLGVSVSRVSRTVEALEGELGALLLQRTTRSMALTEAGALFRERARRLVSEAEALQRSVSDQARAPQGTVRVSVSNLLGQLHVLPLVPELLALHPGLTLALDLSDRVVDLSAEGFDVAIRIGPLADTSHVARRLGSTDRQWLCAAPSYLAAHGIPRHEQELEQHRAVLVTNGALEPYPWYVRRKGRKARPLRLPARALVSQPLAYKDLLVAGLGLGLVYDWAVEREVSAGTLQRVLPEVDLSYEPEPGGEIFLLYAKDRFASPRVRAVVDFFSRRLRAILSRAPA
ncbi:LysR family transcriptional regulator [Aggregicoccus sp. 17bor-14]|uniref:LysR family transcriptional regulator n=1 Tax=Myxococcaceae TaxID=31 RepID=UPI00129C48FA|nr:MULTISPECIES: LysR family transcriptional regulator [Myxococcaceae]MBF5046455.1 LysR family transcriptional regulator [Simulacricoccus sp. 17bor-14]MRI92173.1 LysR family transcriptional regulator [Aggregicoccus sp. 17bor-14]